MEILDSQVITLPTLPRSERSPAFLKVLQKPITAEELANLVISAAELDCAFVIIETWCQKNPEKVLPRPEKESVGSWEMLVETLLKKACRTIIYAAEEQDMPDFYNAVDKYIEVLGRRIVRELHMLGVRGRLQRILARAHQWKETSQGREFALFRTFQTLETIRASTMGTMEERTSRSQPCSTASMQFYQYIVDILWQIKEECLRVENSATPLEKQIVLDRVEQVASALSRSGTHLPIRLGAVNSS